MIHAIIVEQLSQLLPFLLVPHDQFYAKFIVVFVVVIFVVVVVVVAIIVLLCHPSMLLFVNCVVVDVVSFIVWK